MTAKSVSPTSVTDISPACTARRECCQMADRPGGKIADQGLGRPVPGSMPARLVHPVTDCFRRSGILSGARGHTHADMTASPRKPLAVNLVQANIAPLDGKESGAPWKG